jgi:ERCC4-type nuclease
MPFLDIFSSKKTHTKNLPVITIDYREKNSLIPSELSKLNFSIQFKQLLVADYIVSNTAVERKTTTDLKSSIINKRIFQQLLEIKQYPKHFLIIEGPRTQLFNSQTLHENAVRGFLLATALEYQVPILFSKNEKDTAKYISVLAKKKPTEISLRPTKIFRSKKEQQLFILEGFPNIGPSKAKTLLKKFKSLSAIFTAPESELQEILGSRTKDFKSLLE